MNIAFIFAYRKTDTWSTPLSIVNEFKKRGHIVEIFSLFDEYDNYVDTNIYTLLKKEWDIIIHMDWGQHTSPILSELKKTNAFCVMEAGDDPQQFQRNNLKSSYFHLILTPDKRCVDLYQSKNFNAIWWTHFADTDIHMPMDVPLKYIAVCSRGMNNSAPFIDVICNKYPDKIVNKRGFIGKSHTEFLNSGFMVLQESKYKEITRRIFEGMACNKLVLTDRLPKETCIDDLFIENKDILYYDSPNDLLKKIHYYSINKDEANVISLNGYNKTIKNHTQIQRVDKIIDEYNK